MIPNICLDSAFSLKLKDPIDFDENKAYVNYCEYRKNAIKLKCPSANINELAKIIAREWACLSLE